MTATTQDLQARAVPATFQSPADTLAGLRTGVRLVVRRNRIRLAVWWLVVVGLFGYVLAYYQSIFTTQQALDDFAAVSNVPSIKALTGLAAAPNTLGGAVWTKIWMTCALMLAFGVLFLVTRNGRADEEVGRTELLRSRMLGIHALSVATWLVLTILCVAVGVGVAVLSIVGGLDPEGAGVTGSLITGLSLTGVGLVAVGVGALTGQITSTSRAANALGSTVLGVFYVLRMMGDLGNGTLTWVSPIGWGQQMQPWGANRWWPLGLILLFTAVLLGMTIRLEARRDLGSGLLPERPGRPGAPARFARPLGLAVRLQRGPIIGWTITVLLGSLMLVMMIAMIVTVFAVQSATSLRSDEATGIIEPQLAGAVSRPRWVLERLLIPAVGTALLLLAGGALLGYTYGATVGDAGGEAQSLALAALAYWPAVMVFVGLAVALFGFVPRLAIALSWGMLAAMWVVLLVGDALHLPDWVLQVLPFSATPYQPVDAMSWPPVIAMTLIAGALVALGVTRFRNRDIQPG